MELVCALAPTPPSWWTEARLKQDRASSSASHVSVQRAPLQDLFNFSSSWPINARTSMEAVLQGSKVHMFETRLKMLHKFSMREMQKNYTNYAGLIGLTAATDLNCRHRLTLETTLGSEEDRYSVTSFVSSKFESKLSWGFAISHKLHRALTLFSRYSSDDNAHNQFIAQVVHKLNEKTTLSPIFSASTGCHPQAGFSLTQQLAQTGIIGRNSLQIKGFYSGSGAYSFSIKAQAGRLD